MIKNLLLRNNANRLVEVKDSSLIKDAINWIRLIAEDVPDFYQIYVTNENDIGWNCFT